MKNRKRQITDEELDALLSGTPVGTPNAFADQVVIKAAPATDWELDALLSADLVRIRADFTERTLALIEQERANNKLKFPQMRWLLRSGMVAAVLLVGLFSYSIWDNQLPSSTQIVVAETDLAGMELEELLYLEETLTSAQVLIDLQKTVPLSYFIDETDS